MKNCSECVNNKYRLSIELFDREYLGQNSPCVSCKRNPTLSDYFEENFEEEDD